MEKELYERIKASIDAAYMKHLNSLNELAVFAGFDPGVSKETKARAMEPKPKKESNASVSPRMRTLKTLPAVPVHTNGHSENPPTQNPNGAVRVPCENPKCGKKMQRPKECPQCTRKVCSLHWSHRRKICTDCAQRPE